MPSTLPALMHATLPAISPFHIYPLTYTLSALTQPPPPLAQSPCHLACWPCCWPCHTPALRTSAPASPPEVHTQSWLGSHVHTHQLHVRMFESAFQLQQVEASSSALTHYLAELAF